MNPPSSTSTPVTAPARAVDVPATPSVQFHLMSFLLGLAVATGLVGGSVFVLRRPEPPPIALQPPPTIAPTPLPTATATPAPITVFVSGAVVMPGLYLLPADARVGDAISSAGGLTDTAEAATVNQAEALWDGVQVHIPAATAGESAVPVAARMPPAGVSGLAAPAPPMGGSSGLVNLNRVTAGELESLPGIGPSKAEAIIANRPYDTVDDLERVPGIGAKTVDQLREFVAVQ